MTDLYTKLIKQFDLKNLSAKSDITKFKTPYEAEMYSAIGSLSFKWQS